MARRQKEWARRKRDELRAILGGCCVQCGTDQRLEFDLILSEPGNRHHRELSWDQRIRFYWKEHAKRNVQLLCKSHHNTKTKKENRQAYLGLGRQAEQPF